MYIIHECQVNISMLYYQTLRGDTMELESRDPSEGH